MCDKSYVGRPVEFSIDGGLVKGYFLDFKKNEYDFLRAIVENEKGHVFVKHLGDVRFTDGD